MDLTRAQVATLALLCACAGELEALQAGLTGAAVLHLTGPSDPQLSPGGRPKSQAGDRRARIEAVLARFRPEPSGDGR